MTRARVHVREEEIVVLGQEADGSGCGGIAEQTVANVVELSTALVTVDAQVRPEAVDDRTHAAKPRPGADVRNGSGAERVEVADDELVDPQRGR